MDKPKAITDSIIAICTMLSCIVAVGGLTLGCQASEESNRAHYASLVERCKILAEKNLPCTTW